MKGLIVIGCLTVLSLAIGSATSAQEMPAEYQKVLATLGKQGDYKSNVLKANVPRNDLSVTVAKVQTPTPFGFGGWVAMTKGTGGMDVLMGDLVLAQEEVNPVMSALLDNGLDVTALLARRALGPRDPRRRPQNSTLPRSWRSWGRRDSRQVMSTR